MPCNFIRVAGLETTIAKGWESLGRNAHRNGENYLSILGIRVGLGSYIHLCINVDIHGVLLDGARYIRIDRSRRSIGRCAALILSPLGALSVHDLMTITRTQCTQKVEIVGKRL